MASSKGRIFGRVIRDRRRQLDLTQEEVARRIATSTPYVGHLESGKRHPSDKVVTRLAEVLGLDRRDLFFLANPAARMLLLNEQASPRASAWNEFRRNDRVKRIYRITTDEMDLLSRLAKMGDVRSSRDFTYVLFAVRHALGR